MSPEVTEKGSLVTISLGGSRLHATRHGQTLKIVDASAETRGRGLGTQLYLALMRYAAENRLEVHSDATVEEGAIRVWEGLKKRGYPVVRHPRATLVKHDEPNDGSNHFLFVDDGKDLKTPVFTVRPSMQKLALRVAQRFLASRPKGPTVSLLGKRYVLSNHWSMIGDFVEALGGDKPGGPTVIPPPKGKYSWFWIYDKDRQIIAMYRWSDGDEKLYGRATQYMRDLHRLNKLGQINHVDTSEFRAIERVMRQKQADTLQSLKQWVQDNETALEKQVREMVQEHFDTRVRPEIDARLVFIEQGIYPDDFEVNPRLLDFKSEKEQAATWVMHDVIKDVFDLKRVEAYVADQFHGLDVTETDVQLVYFIRNDIIEEYYDEMGV